MLQANPLLDMPCSHLDQPRKTLDLGIKKLLFQISLVPPLLHPPWPSHQQSWLSWQFLRPSVSKYQQPNWCQGEPRHVKALYLRKREAESARIPASLLGLSTWTLLPMIADPEHFVNWLHIGHCFWRFVHHWRHICQGSKAHSGRAWQCKNTWKSLKWNFWWNLESS